MHVHLFRTEYWMGLFCILNLFPCTHNWMSLFFFANHPEIYSKYKYICLLLAKKSRYKQMFFFISITSISIPSSRLAKKISIIKKWFFEILDILVLTRWMKVLIKNSIYQGDRIGWSCNDLVKIKPEGLTWVTHDFPKIGIQKYVKCKF